MIFGQDRQELRQMYVDAWRKAREGAVLSPLEAQIAEVVADHPEYHGAVSERIWTSPTRRRTAKRIRFCTWACISRCATR